MDLKFFFLVGRALCDFGCELLCGPKFVMMYANVMVVCVML